MKIIAPMIWLVCIPTVCAGFWVPIFLLLTGCAQPRILPTPAPPMEHHSELLPPAASSVTAPADLPSHSDAAWRRLRAEKLEQDGKCAVCGITSGLQVHHKIPRSVDPGLFLVYTNLATFCQRHHYWVGHGGQGWSRYNANVDATIKAVRAAHGATVEVRP